MPEPGIEHVLHEILNGIAVAQPVDGTRKAILLFGFITYENTPAATANDAPYSRKMTPSDHTTPNGRSLPELLKLATLARTKTRDAPPACKPMDLPAYVFFAGHTTP